MPVRQSGEWMDTVDERILEHLRDGGPARAEDIANRSRFPNDVYWIRERCRLLAQAGYVEPDRRTRRWYAITSDGIGYLEGRMLANEIYPEPRRSWPGHVCPTV